MMYAQLFCETLFNSAEIFFKFSMNLIIFSIIKVALLVFFATISFDIAKTNLWEHHWSSSDRKNMILTPSFWNPNMISGRQPSRFLFFEKSCQFNRTLTQFSKKHWVRRLASLGPLVRVQNRQSHIIDTVLYHIVLFSIKYH